MKTLRYLRPLLAIASYLMCANGYALEPNIENIIADHEISVWRQALSATELMRLRSEMQNLRVYKKACDIQMESGQLPLACYKLQVLVDQWPPLISLMPAKEKLEKACLVGAKNLQVGSLDLPRAIDNNCLGAIHKQLEINRYKQGVL